jgi:hypothetical protein
VRKVWEALALVVVLIIVISIASETVAQYLPIVGILVAAMIVLAVGILIFRLVFARRKFW